MPRSCSTCLTRSAISNVEGSGLSTAGTSNTPKPSRVASAVAPRIDNAKSALGPSAGLPASTSLSSNGSFHSVINHQRLDDRNHRIGSQASPAEGFSVCARSASLEYTSGSDTSKASRPKPANRPKVYAVSESTLYSPLHCEAINAVAKL